MGHCTVEDREAGDVLLIALMLGIQAKKLNNTNSLTDSESYIAVMIQEKNG